MNSASQKLRKSRRSASVIVCVLVVILIIGMLSMQTIQTLALVRRGDDDRDKIMQVKELNELASAIDWSTIESTSLRIQIPDSVSTASEPESRTAILERQTVEDNPETAKIVVRFPAEMPGEITTTWEPEHESID